MRGSIWGFLVFAVLLLAGCNQSDKLLEGDHMVRQGLDAYEVSDYQKAASDFEASIDMKRSKYDDSIVYTYLSSAYQGMGQSEQAMDACRKAVEKDPQNYKAYTNLGVLCRQAGKDQEAMDAYLKAIEINPDYAQPYASLGALLVIKDQPAEAIPYLEKAVIRDSGLASNYANLALAYAKTGDFEKAEDALANAEKYEFENMENLRFQVNALR